MNVIPMSFLKDVLEGSVVSGTSVSGVVLISNYNIALTRANSEYITGNILSGVKVPFKAWGSSSAFKKLKTEEYSNTPTLISGTVDNYNGVCGIIINDISAVSEYTADQFLEVRYNVDAYFTALMSLVNNNISEKAKAIVDAVFTNDIVSEFKTEFAATSMHDNCKGGLLAHTYKCISLLNWAITTYPNITGLSTDSGLVASQDRKDLLFLGTLLHDLGKIREMKLGVYQNCSKVTHRFLGIEFISPFKDMIVSSYSEKWYYDLISVFLQHHGEFGDDCRTVISYIVHRVDWFESSMTLLQQTLSESIIKKNTGDSIKLDNIWLSVD